MGVVASGWAKKPLGEVCDILDRLRKPITKRDRIPGPYPYYGATGILDQVADYIFEEPLVLIGEDGAKWEAGENSAFAIDGRTWVNNHAHVIRPHRDELLDDWLIYFLNASDLMPFVSGMTVPKLNQGRLREIPIPIPPPEEQRRIVAVLDEAFEGLDRARAHAEANLLDNQKLSNTIFNEVLTEPNWQCATLGNLCHIARGGSPRPIKQFITNDPDGVNWIKIGDAQVGGRYIDRTKEKIRKEGISRSRYVKPGAFLLSNSMSFGRPYILRTSGCIHDGWLVLDPDYQRVNQDYLYFALSAPKTFQQFDQLAAGSTVRNLNIGLVARVEIPLPELEDQLRVVEVLNESSHSLSRVRSNAETNLKNLDDLRQSLLQRAFAGELT